MSKILIFTTRQMCYDSAGFFAKKLAMNLEILGVECELCMFAEDDIPGRYRLFAATIAKTAGLCILPQAEELLEQYIGRTYLAVIDFNSKLPRITMEDGSFFIDHINAPFINYILDHPLYHHSMLASPLQNYHVITPDENHAAYVKTYYPHVKSVLMQPLGAAEVRNAPNWQESKKSVLFMGTYHEPEAYYQAILQIKQQNGLPGKQDILHMIEYMTANPSLTVEQALEHIWENEYHWNPKEKPKLFRLWMNHCYLAEIYMRNVARKQVVQHLAKAGIPVEIIGDGWENTSFSGIHNVRLSEAVAFSKAYRKIAECRVLLNSSPFFQGGMHDRIPAAMANHTVLLTDANPYLKKVCEGDHTMHMYASDIAEKELVELAKEALEHEAKSNQMVIRAYEMYQMKYTWLQIAQNVLQYIESM